jgi:hypothetical protein
LLLKIYIVVPIDHMFCVKLLLNKYEIFKVSKFCQILHFIVKIYHNFDYQLQLCFVCHAHYTPFTCGKGLLKF